MKPAEWKRARLDDLPPGTHIRMLDGTHDGARFATYVKREHGIWYTVRVFGGTLVPQDKLIGAYEVLGGPGLEPD